MAWTIEYSETARKNIRKLDHQTRGRIKALLEKRVALLDNPRDAGKALRGPLSTFWVYRAGDYRIICDIQDDRLVILIVTTGHRSAIYS
ncbi:type II toxin-antitoxin system RelE family toxin [Mesorhizobium marinum]|uniref:Type II toxin-antitoxin system RelE/ParE family toxin n=1 Tax=Mesorhizobium marinum TaxID=3228790 RepID=A0ABV3R1B9_9HYPH